MKKIFTTIRKLLSAINFCFQVSWRVSRFFTVVRILQQLIQPLFNLLLAFLGKEIIDMFIERQAGLRNYKEILCLLILIIVTNVIVGVADKVVEYSYEVHSELLSKEAQNIIMEKYLDADLQSFDDPEYRDCLEVLTEDVDSMINVLWNTMKMLSSCISFVIAFVIVIDIGIQYGILLLILAIPSTMISKHYVKEMYDVYNETAKDERMSHYYYNMACDRNYAMQVRLYGIRDVVKGKFQIFWERKFLLKKSKMKKRTILLSFLDAIPYISIGFILAILAIGILDGRRSVGDYTLYSGVLIQLLSELDVACASLLQIYSDYMRIYNVKRINLLENKMISEGKLKLAGVEKIEFQNVSFTYPGTDKEVLSEISFTINSAEKIAIIGINGSGKSTIIKLLLHFYELDNGKILINDIDINQYTAESLRNAFSVYFQEEPNFIMSIRENIELSDNSASENDKEMKQLLYDCGGQDVLEKIGFNLDTPYSKEYYEEGVELSGGQKQKLSIARTLHKNAAVYVLDEPSAALDPEAEYHLLTTMKEYSRDRITIFVSHRMSNMRLADKILLIENGRKIEFGTHKELMDNHGRYEQLINYQMKKF